MRTIYVFLIGLIAISLTSCKGIMDKEPLDRISEAQVWNDAALVDAYLADVYSEMKFLYNANDDQPGGWWTTTFITDLTDEGHTDFSWLNTTSFYKAGAMVASSEWPIQRWGYYSTIRKMNFFLEKMAGSTLPADQKNKSIARIRFARAFTYFILARDYGGIPLILKAQNATDPHEELYAKRNKEIEIYDFALSELSDIIKNNYLPAVAYDNGLPTKYAVLALKSQIALYAANLSKWGTEGLNGLLGVPSSKSQELYQASYDASNQIIEEAKFTLYNGNSDKVKNFKGLFTTKKNSEVIYAREFNSTTQGVAHFWDNWNYPYGFGAWPGDGSGPYLEMAEEFEWIDKAPGSPGTLDRTAIQSGLWSMDALFGKKEPRFFASLYTNNTPFKSVLLDMTAGYLDGTGNQVVSHGVNLSYDLNTGFGILKYCDETYAPYWDDSRTDWIVFRLGYILLNHTEAAFELGKTSDALAAINQVRNRAGVTPLTTITRENIRHERKVELAFENAYRYYDLKSWRLSESLLSKQYSGIEYYKDKVTSNYKLVILKNIDGSTPPLFRPKDYYLPLTPSRISNNPNLAPENPGY